MNLPFRPHFFSLRDVSAWVDLHKPTQIEMNDGQYAWFANLSCANRRDFSGIPIVFVDAPA